MSNMEYCRFQNTLNDLEDCVEHIEDNGLSKDEYCARHELILLCIDIANNHKELVE